ncbi:MAG: hypothetical protein V3V78_03105 [Candidatus Woesearchaeota archaeon]
MTTEFIIGIIILAVIGLIVFKITKSIFKAIFLASTILAITIALISFLVVSDATEFTEKSKAIPSIYLLEEDGIILAGFSGTFMNESSQPTFVSGDALGPYEENDLDELLGENYKLYLVKKQAFDLIDTIDGGNLLLSKEEVFTLIDSETPLDDYIIAQVGAVSASQLAAFRKDMFRDMNIENDDGFRGVLFAAMLTTGFKEPIWLFDQIKQKNIIIYKETPMFKLIKFAPTSYLKKLMKTEEVN